jgi:hypothetical protein
MLNSDTTINSSLFVSGSTISNNNSTIHSSLHIDTLVIERSVLSVNSSSLSIIVNIIQNYGWIKGEYHDNISSKIMAGLMALIML